MIAADTSSLSAYFQGLTGPDTDRINVAFSVGELILPPVVILEMLSDPRPTHRVELEEILNNIEMMPILEGYWRRAGELRRGLRLRGFKAKVADVQIAQSCIDHAVPLITRDTDFRRFVEHFGLKLA